MAAYTKSELNSQLLSIFLPKIPLPPPDWELHSNYTADWMRLFERKQPLRHPIFLFPTKTDYSSTACSSCINRLFSTEFCFCIFFEFILTLQNKTEVEDSTPIQIPTGWPSALKRCLQYALSWSFCSNKITSTSTPKHLKFKFYWKLA